jgi:hypothetical protein
MSSNRFIVAGEAWGRAALATDLVLEAEGGRWTSRIEARSAEARAAVHVQVDGADHLAIGDRTLAIDTPIGAMVLPFDGLAGPPATTGTTGTTGTIEQDVLGPALKFSTYWGGAMDDSGHAIALGPNADRLAAHHAAGATRTAQT